MTSTPSLPAQIEPSLDVLIGWLQSFKAPHDTRYTKALLVTLQQHERLQDELRGARLDRDIYKARLKQLNDACQRYMHEVALLRQPHERLEAVVEAARNLQKRQRFMRGMSPNDRDYGPGNAMADALAALDGQEASHD